MPPWTAPRVGRSRHLPRQPALTACQSDRLRPGRRLPRSGRSPPGAAAIRSAQPTAPADAADGRRLARRWRPTRRFTRPAPRSSWSPSRVPLRVGLQNQSHVTVGGCGRVARPRPPAEPVSETAIPVNFHLGWAVNCRLARLRRLSSAQSRRSEAAHEKRTKIRQT